MPVSRRPRAYPTDLPAAAKRNHPGQPQSLKRTAPWTLFGSAPRVQAPGYFQLPAVVHGVEVAMSRPHHTAQSRNNRGPQHRIDLAAAAQRLGRIEDELGTIAAS